MLYITLVTAGILSIPLLAQWPWTLSDFVIMGILVSGTGFAYELIKNKGGTTMYRAAAGVAVLSTFLLTWVNLAVGLIGGENNPINALYFIIPVVGLIGAGIARFEPRGMAYTLFAMALTQLVIPVIAFILYRPELNDGVIRTFGASSFFAMLFVASGLLFQNASAAGSRSKQPSK